MGTGTLQFPQAGATLASDFFTRSPHILTQQMLIQVLSPQTKEAPFFNDIVRKLSKPKEKFRAANALGNLFLKVTGIPYIATAGTISLVEEEARPVTDWVAEPVANITAPLTRGAGTLAKKVIDTPVPISGVGPLTHLVPQPPAQQTPPPSQSVNRSQYAAMFPNDIASDLIRQQNIGKGIGSLAGE